MENGPATGLGLGDRLGTSSHGMGQGSSHGGGLLSSFSSFHGNVPGAGLGGGSGSGGGGGGGGLAMVAALALQSKQADEVMDEVMITPR